jgi:hypothetical protein
MRRLWCILAIVVLLISIAGTPPAAAVSALIDRARRAVEGAACLTVEGYPATPFYLDIEFAKKLWFDKDTAALRKLEDAKRMVWLRGGVEVMVVKRLVDYVEIRPKGEIVTAWTLPTAVDCPEKKGPETTPDTTGKKAPPGKKR